MGLGTLAEADEWYATHQLPTDEVDHLDRVFAIRYHAGQLYRPMRTDIAAGLEPEDRAGTWHLIRADHPDDALGHARKLISSDLDCTSEGECPACFATGLAAGSWSDLMDGRSVSPQARHQLSVDLRLSELHARSKPVTPV